MKKKVLLIGQHGIIGNWPLLLSCYDGDECIFNIEEFSNAVSSIEASVNDAPKIGRATLDEPIYDLQGRRLSASISRTAKRCGRKTESKTCPHDLSFPEIPHPG